MVMKLSDDPKVMLNIRINKEMKKELKLISVYEEISITDIVTGFIGYGLKKYAEEQTLIRDK